MSALITEAQSTGWGYFSMYNYKYISKMKVLPHFTACVYHYEM